MNCDEAFDALTDPAQTDAESLARHLADCPRCRELKLVLEPALSLLCGELPAERPYAWDSPDELSKDGFGAQKPVPFLSTEAVALAESVAQQLTSHRAAKCATSNGFFPVRRGLAIAARSTALVLLGALAVLCFDQQSRSGRPVVPAAAPLIRGQSCTRGEIAKDSDGKQDARNVILSCVECHLKKGRSAGQRVPTLQFWPPRPAANRIILVTTEMCRPSERERQRCLFLPSMV